LFVLAYVAFIGVRVWASVAFIFAHVVFASVAFIFAHVVFIVARVNS
jgi:hypothetical protein